MNHFNETNYRWQKIIQFSSTKDRSKLETSNNKKCFSTLYNDDSHLLEMLFLFNCPWFFYYFFTTTPCPTCILGNLGHHILTISKQFLKWHWYCYTLAFKLVCKLVDSKDDCQAPFSFQKQLSVKIYIILSSKTLAIWTYLYLIATNKFKQWICNVSNNLWFYMLGFWGSSKKTST